MPTCIAQISDLHFHRTDAGVVEALAADLQGLQPDLLVVSGDLTQRARAGQYRSAVAFLRRLPGPQLVVPGNHDVPLLAFWRRIFSPLGRFRQFVTADLWPTWANDEVFVLGMNTACRLAPRWNGFWKDGRITPAQRDELAARFAAARPGQARVLVAHHPFVEPPGGHAHGIVHGAAEALRVLDAAGVDLILSGHLHLSMQADVRSRHPHVQRPMINLLAGSATSTRRREPCNSYNVIRVDCGRIEVEIRQFCGGRWENHPSSAAAGVGG